MWACAGEETTFFVSCSTAYRFRLFLKSLKLTSKVKTTVNYFLNYSMRVSEILQKFENVEDDTLGFHNKHCHF